MQFDSMPGIIHNHRKLLPRRRSLRRQPTMEEKILWTVLRRRQLLEFKFRRQHSIGAWVVDFYCPQVKLIIEVDGAAHFTKQGKLYDSIRDEAIFNELGITVLRIANRRIVRDLPGVIKEIKTYLNRLDK